MRINHRHLRQIIREEIARNLYEQDEEYGPEIPPAGQQTSGDTADGQMIEQLTSYSKKLRSMFSTVYPGVYIHHTVFRQKNDYPAVGIGITGLDEDTMQEIADKVRGTPGLPSGIEFVPGDITLKVRELAGRPWNALTDSGKGDQPVVVLRTSLSSMIVGRFSGRRGDFKFSSDQ